MDAMRYALRLDLCTLLYRHAIVGRPRFFLAFLAARQARDPSAHYDACLDLGQAPWRVF